MNFRQKTLSLILLTAMTFGACTSPKVESGDSAPTVDTNLQGYIMVHLEPHSEVDLDEHWVYLQELIELSDSYDHKLTLSFTANWEPLLLNDSEALALVHEWEANGHEISAHHHETTHAAWDGYTNDPSYRKDPRYKGDIEDMMEIIYQFSATGSVLSGSMKDPGLDWPEGLLYRSYGSVKDKLDNLMSLPLEEVINEETVLTLTKAAYLTGKPVDVELGDIEEAILGAYEGEVLGLTLSDESFSNSGVFDGVEDLFVLLAEEGVQIQTLSSLLD